MDEKFNIPAKFNPSLSRGKKLGLVNSGGMRIETFIKVDNWQLARKVKVVKSKIVGQIFSE